MKYVILIISLVVVITSPAYANEPLLNIQKVETQSGITAWLVEDTSLPIISMDFAFKGAGAIHDGEEKQGVSRLLSNMLDEGAGDKDSQTFQKILSDHSISLSFYSGRDNFGGSLKTLSRHQDMAFDMLKLALTSPRFDSEPLERMKQANIARIKSAQADPEWIAARLFNDRAFEGHPYALNSGGTITSLQSITDDDLRNHMKTWLTQDRLHIGVMGDISADELKSRIEEVFSNLPQQNKEKSEEKFDIKNQGNLYVYNRDIPQSIISVALPSLDENHPDYYTLQVMNYIFGAGGFGSRLMEEAREKRGLTYGIYSRLNHQNNIDFISINTSTKNESVTDMINIIQVEMTKMKTNPVTADELKDTKSYLTGSLPLSLSSTDRIAGLLLSLQLNNRPMDYLNQYQEKINAVTADDVQRVAQKLLYPEKMIKIIVGNPQELENAIEIESLPNVN